MDSRIMKKLITIIFLTCSVVIAKSQKEKQSHNFFVNTLIEVMKIDDEAIQYSLSHIKELLNQNTGVIEEKNTAATVFVLFRAIVNQTKAKTKTFAAYNFKAHKEITKDILLQSKPFLLNVINTSNNKTAVSHAYITLGLIFPDDQELSNFFLKKFLCKDSSMGTKLCILGITTAKSPHAYLILKYALQSPSLTLVGNAACNPVVQSAVYPLLLDDLVISLLFVDQKAEITNYNKKKLTYRFLVSAIAKYPNRYKYKSILLTRFMDSKNQRLIQLIKNLSELEKKK